jgi:ribonuclease E
VHHPSYQERGLPNTPNNRRRRRRRLDEPVAKEESQTTKVISRPTPILSGKSEPAAESELLDLGERTVKPQLIKAPKEIDPPEVVAIEMSPEEQDVYAWMGISPLVRLNREIKNPKSVILSVVLPGESDQTEEENEEFAESSSAPSSFALASDTVQHSAPVIRSSAVTPTYEDTEESEPLLVTSSAETSELEMPSDSTAIGESDNNRPLIRRRRRRSSATDGEDSSAS